MFSGFRWKENVCLCREERWAPVSRSLSPQMSCPPSLEGLQTGPVAATVTLAQLRTRLAKPLNQGAIEPASW